MFFILEDRKVNKKYNALQILLDIVRESTYTKQCLLFIKFPLFEKKKYSLYVNFNLRHNSASFNTCSYDFLAF